MKTQREQEGWLGPVRAVVVEMADFLERGGTQTLGPRVPLFTLEYDIQGKLVGEKTCYILHGESGVNDCITRYDTEGNISALFCFSGGEFLYKVIPTYDSNKRVVEELFCDAMGNPRYKREHKYDARGKPVEMSHCEINGTIVNKLKYDNEYDSVGNLIKVTILKLVDHGGKSSYKPVSVHFQTVTYY
jgi:hypothetical protein